MTLMACSDIGGGIAFAAFALGFFGFLSIMAWRIFK